MTVKRAGRLFIQEARMLWELFVALLRGGY